MLKHGHEGARCMPAITAESTQQAFSLKTARVSDSGGVGHLLGMQRSSHTLPFLSTYCQRPAHSEETATVLNWQGILPGCSITVGGEAGQIKSDGGGGSVQLAIGVPLAQNGDLARLWAQPASSAQRKSSVGFTSLRSLSQ